jgi:hypothetical protein
MNTTSLSNIRIVFLPANCPSQLQPLGLGIINAFKCHYRKQLIRKTATMIDGGLLQNATQTKLDVLSAVDFIAEAWRLITPTTIKNCFVKCGFLTDYVSSNGDSAVKLSEGEEDDWHGLQPLECGLNKD